MTRAVDITTSPDERARLRGDTIWGFDAERQPPADMPGVQLVRVPTHTWFLIAWERIGIDAPGPDRCRPYCWGLNDVAMHVYPYVADASRGLERYGDWKHTLSHWSEDVDFDGARWQYGYGQVVWRRPRWWFRCWLRVVPPDGRRML